MKISEFRISRYGPLPDSNRIALQNFNLFFGENEDGKTLTIDALVKMMLGANIRDFQRIDRVDENPEGYVIVKDIAGKEFKIPEKGTLTKLTGLTPSECRNIFVIRNSDLSIVYPENDFYINIADKLVGLRAKALLKIKESLRIIGKITPSNAFKNDKDEKLKTRIEKAGTLVNKIDDLFEQIGAEDLDKLEIESVNLTDEINATQANLELHEAARKREIFEKGDAAVTKLEESLNNCSILSEFNQKDEQTWRDANRDIEKLNNEQKTLKEQLKGFKGSLSNAERELDVGQASIAAFDTKKQKIDEEIRPALKNYEKEREKTIHQSGNNKILSILSPLSTIVVICGLLGAMLTHSLFFYAFAGVSGFLTAAMWVLRFKYASDDSHIQAHFESIKLNASQYGLSGDNAEAVLNKIGNFEQNFKTETKKLQSLTTKKETLQFNVSDLEDKKIPELDRQTEALITKVEGLKTTSGVNNIDDYSEHLSRRTTLEKSIAEQEKVLESLFEKKGRNRQEIIANWKQKINEFSEFKDKAQTTKFDEKEVTETKEKQTNSKNRQLEINEKLTSFQEQLKEVERETNDILRLDEPLYCRSCTDLEGNKKALESFELLNENNRNNVLAALQIFEEIEKEEKNKVSDLFGAGSKISTVFSQITGGRYAAVHFNTGSGKIQVETKNGNPLDADKLSSGAFDQLYLSIRLALGEKLLKGDKAFFIMDDPLIKADSKRLQTQLSLLKQISELGWQIIYFTAKDEVKNALQEQISAGSINLVELTDNRY